MNKDEENKKRGKYVTKKSIQLNNLLEAAEEYNFVGKRTYPVNLKKDKAEVEFLTKGTCLFPSRFLNNDRTCIKCDIYELCACSIKTLGKNKQ
jgi:hypothetical protein